LIPRLRSPSISWLLTSTHVSITLEIPSPARSSNSPRISVVINAVIARRLKWSISRLSVATISYSSPCRLDSGSITTLLGSNCSTAQ
jgi:hypothetical protein